MKVVLKVIFILSLFLSPIVGLASVQTITLTNPGFETGDLTGWSSSGAPAVMNMFSHSGTYCVALNVGLDLFQDKLGSVSEGDSAIFGIHAWPAGTSIKATPFIEWYDSGNNLLGSRIVGNVTTEANYRYIEVTDTAPTTATKITLGVNVTGISGGAFIDDAVIAGDILSELEIQFGLVLIGLLGGLVVLAQYKKK